MRVFPMFVALLLAACVQTETVKTRTVIKTVEGPIRIKYLACPADISAWKQHCASITSASACDAEQRCEWVDRESKPHCRRYRCKPEGLPWPRYKS